MHGCTECGIDNDNHHSTSMCHDCQILLLMALLEDCEAAPQHLYADGQILRLLRRVWNYKKYFESALPTELRNQLYAVLEPSSRP